MKFYFHLKDSSCLQTWLLNKHGLSDVCAGGIQGGLDCLWFGKMSPQRNTELDGALICLITESTERVGVR